MVKRGLVRCNLRTSPPPQPIHILACNRRTTVINQLEMSWEDAVASDGDDDWENLRADTGVDVPAITNATWGSGSDSEEEDATAKELAAERAEKNKQNALMATQHKKTFAEIEAEREAKDALKQLDNHINASEDRVLTAAEQRQAMLQGLKAAEDADHLLTQELFGGASQSVIDQEQSRLSFDQVVSMISNMKLNSIIEFEKLANVLSSKIPKNDRQAVIVYFQNLIQEILKGDICTGVDSLHAELDGFIKKKTEQEQEMKERAAVAAKEKAEENPSSDKDADGEYGFDIGDIDNMGSSDGEESDGVDFM